jgi:hypothetical protein
MQAAKSKSMEASTVPHFSNANGMLIMLPPIMVAVRLEHDVKNDAFRLVLSNEGKRTSAASYGGVNCRISALAVARSYEVSPTLLHQNEKEMGASSCSMGVISILWHLIGSDFCHQNVLSSFC